MTKTTAIAHIEAPTLTLTQCKAEMNRAYTDILTHANNVVSSGIALGNAALQAKAQLPHGEFTPWIQKNFKFSHQWAAACMRAADAWELSKKKALTDEMRTLVLGANTVEKLAALKRPLEGKAPTTRVTKGTKCDRPPASPAPDDEVIDVESVDVTERDREITLAEREAAVAKREAACDAREAWLTKREASLDEREARLAKAEAGTPLPAATLAAGKSKKAIGAAKAIASLDERNAKRRARAATKASRKAGMTPRSDDQGEGEGLVAKTASTPPRADTASDAF